MKINANYWRINIVKHYNIETVVENDLKEHNYEKSNSTISDGYAKRYR